MNDKYNFDSISFGMRLSEIRKFNKMTQEDVADMVGVSVKTIQNWERGEKMPFIDNTVALADCFNMTVGEILEDEKYRLFKKKTDSRKRSIETLAVPSKSEVFIEFTEDRDYDRYEVWVLDEVAKYKYMYCSVEKVIPYSELKNSMMEQADDIVKEYREWLLTILQDTDEDKEIRDQLEKKVKCEESGMAVDGAFFADGIVFGFGEL